MPTPIYHKRFAFPPSARDLNDHVNNVEYVRMLQDVATEHVDANGWPMARLFELGWSWVVRSHHIDYRHPCLPGEPISLYTWVHDFQKIHSLRRYRFVRETDGLILAEAETDWVSVSIHTGRPIPIPADFLEAFPPTPPETARLLGAEFRPPR